MHALRRAGAMAAAAGAAGALTTENAPAEKAPRFRFGVVADIQYCDCDNATNFGGSETRNYRDTLAQTQRAVRLWNGLTPAPLFVAQLGDLIDGQNAGEYGAFKGQAPQSDSAMEAVLGVLAGCRAPMLHAIGNHELYNFGWARLKQLLHRPAAGWACVREESGGDSSSGGSEVDGSAFRFVRRPVDGWTVLVINAYEHSVIRGPASEGYREARALIEEYNPNDCFGGVPGVDFFADSIGRKQRYAPFNGGLGARGLAWVRREVVAARERGDRIIVLSHIPIHAAGGVTNRTLLFDGDELKKARRASYLRSMSWGAFSAFSEGSSARLYSRCNALFSTGAPRGRVWPRRRRDRRPQPPRRLRA